MTELPLQVDCLIRVRCSFQQYLPLLVVGQLFSLTTHVLSKMLKSGFQGVGLLKAPALFRHRLLLVWWLKSARSQPVGHVRTGLALTRLSKNEVPLQS